MKKERERGREGGIACVLVCTCMCVCVCVCMCVCDTGGPLGMIVCAGTHRSESEEATSCVSQCLASLGYVGRHLLADLFFKTFSCVSFFDSSEQTQKSQL